MSLDDLNLEARDLFDGEPFLEQDIQTYDPNLDVALDLVAPNSRFLRDTADDGDLSDCEEELNDCSQAVSSCRSSLAAAQAEIAAAQAELQELKDLLAPPEGSGGSGAWSHSTPSSVGCRFGDAKVTGSYTDQLSVEYVSGTSFEFTRENSSAIEVDDNGVTVKVPGNVNFKVTTSPDPSSTGISLSLSGNRGVTSTDTVNLTAGTTYYVFGQGANVIPSCGDPSYSANFELKGTFDTTDPTNLGREFVITLTVDAEGNIIE